MPEILYKFLYYYTTYILSHAVKIIKPYFYPTNSNNIITINIKIYAWQENTYKDTQLHMLTTHLWIKEMYNTYSYAS